MSGGCAAGRDPNAPAWGAVVGAPWWGALIRASAWLRGPCELCRAGGDRYGEAASASEAAKGLQDGSRGNEASFVSSSLRRGRHRCKSGRRRNRIRKIGAPGEQRPSRCCRSLGVGSAPTTLRRTAARRLGRSPPGGRSARAVCKGGSGRPSERRGGRRSVVAVEAAVSGARPLWAGVVGCRALQRSGRAVSTCRRCYSVCGQGTWRARALLASAAQLCAPLCPCSDPPWVSPSILPILRSAAWALAMLAARPCR